MKTLAILEGWAGGPKLSREFSKKAKQQGLMKTKEPQNANVIVAHSTGCYMLPKDNQAELIVLINPPYWPGQSIIKRWLNLGKDELKFLRKQQGTVRYLINKFWEVFYIFAKPSYTWSVLKNQSHLDFLENLRDKKVILIRNEQDEFCSPKINQTIKRYKNVRYAEVSGFHSNYYSNPRPYLDLIQKNLETK